LVLRRVLNGFNPAACADMLKDGTGLITQYVVFMDASSQGSRLSLSRHNERGNIFDKIINFVYFP
jgi:hypothetical protein